MRVLRVVMSRRARSDVNMIRDHIAERSPSNADAFVARLGREIVALGTYGAGAAVAPSQAHLTSNYDR